MTATAQTHIDSYDFVPHLQATPARIRTVHGRALCYHVELADGSQVFVKQARRAAGGDVIREARTVAALHQIFELTTILPEVLAVDDRKSLAVYRGYQHWQALGDLVGRPGDISQSACAALGSALARLHGVDPGHAACTVIEPTGPLGRPEPGWFTVTPASLTAYPAGYREVWASVAPARDALDALVGRWQATGLVHGDIKSDNVLVRPGGDPAVVFVDWETAGWGDPLWDVGSLLGDFLGAWLCTLRLSAGGSLATWLSSSCLSFDSIRSRVCAVVAAYGGLVGQDRLMTVQYAGCYLLQRALAAGMQHDRLDARALLTAHLATRLLTRPDRVAEVLL